MGTRSYWLWKISEQTGSNIRDVKALHEYFAAKNLVCGELRNNDQLEGVAHYFGVEDARNLPVAIAPKTRKARKPQEPFKSALSKEEMKALKLEGITVPKIAKLAGISKQAVYLHLKG
jgi:hypothetical protein